MKIKTIYRTMVPCLGVFAVANFALALYVFVRVRRPVEYKVSYVEPPRVVLPMMTNETATARPGLLAGVSERYERPVPTPLQYQPVSWRMKYHYCIVSGRRTAFLNGVKVQVGDVHAYGIVRDIFPERIYFEGGAFIENVIERSETNASGSTTADSVP